MQVDLRQCRFIKERKKLTISSEVFAGSFPKTFEVKSHHTGYVLAFKKIGIDDPLFDPDQWDGEQAIYRPIEKTKNVDFMVVFNEY